MRVTLSPVVVEGERRIGVFFPYDAELKDRLKDVLSVRWSKKPVRAAHLDNPQKCWHVPWGGIAARDVRDTLKQDPRVTMQAHDEIVELMRVATHDECSPLGFEKSVLQPWEHQAHGASAMATLPGFGAGWDMGSGKTKSCYDTILNAGFMRSIVCCPLSVCDVWEDQAPIHGPGVRVCRLDGMTMARKVKKLERELAACRANGDPILVVINYESVWRGKIAELIARIDWDYAIADESHRIKNHKSKSTKWLWKYLRPAAAHRTILSGTPLGNGNEDIFGQFLFMDPSVYGDSWSRFRNRYLDTDPMFPSKVTGYRNIDEFRSRMAMVMTRVRLEDVVDLPPYRDIPVHVTLGKEARDPYTELESVYITRLKEGVVVASNALTRLLRLQQITSGFLGGIEDQDEPAIVGREKRDAATEVVGGIDPSEPVVVFTRFSTDTRMVHDIALACGRPCYEISGRQNTVALWRESCARGEGPLIAVQIQAGGVGIDLTAAAYCMYLSVGFSLTDYMQSRARTHRPGQRRSVTYYHVIARKSVDEIVYKALESKRRTVEATLSKLGAGVDSDSVIAKESESLILEVNDALLGPEKDAKSNPGDLQT